MALPVRVAKAARHGQFEKLFQMGTVGSGSWRSRAWAHGGDVSAPVETARSSRHAPFKGTVALGEES
jgi:hypothetical protein